jgi:GGDEF domain-containing protein
VATFPEDGDNLGTLLQCADEAMYAAKKKEGGSVQVA